MGLERGIKTNMPYGMSCMKGGTVYVGCSGYNYNTVRDGLGNKWPSRVGVGRTTG